eukprot:7089689-Pyramimonas_sp.AAC.1
MTVRAAHQAPLHKRHAAWERGRRGVTQTSRRLEAEGGAALHKCHATRVRSAAISTAAVGSDAITVPRAGNMHLSFPRLVPTPGICPFPFRDWSSPVVRLVVADCGPERCVPHQLAERCVKQ